MEEKLFWVALVSGACAVALRLFLKKEERLNSTGLTAIVHGLDVPTGFVLVGVLEVVVSPVVIADVGVARAVQRQRD